MVLNANNSNDLQIKISVIIPIYKATKYLESLLESVCGQTFGDIEIICVLDGPDEEAENILHEFEEKDRRVHVIVQEHGGAGAARNNGMRNASGKYLMFLDADDQYKESLLEKLYTKAEETGADVTMCSYTHENHWLNTKRQNIGYDYARFAEKEATDPSEVEDLYSSFTRMTYNKLFRKELIDNNDLSFMETNTLNDNFFVTAAVTCANKIAVIKEDFLTKREHINENSISETRDAYPEEFFLVMEKIKDWLQEKGLWEKYKDTYCGYFGQVAHWHARHGINDRFIDEMAKTLSTDTIWCEMGNDELVECLNLNTDKMSLRQQKLQAEVDFFSDKDNQGTKKDLEMTKNEIAVISEIRNRLKTEYGRDLDKHEERPAKGIAGILHHTQKRDSVKKVIEIDDVVAAGHLTTGSHALVFFLPVPVESKSVKIEDISIAVRADGYYPFARSEENGNRYTKLGIGKTHIYGGDEPIRKEEVRLIAAYVSKGVGIRIEIIFEHQLCKDKKGTPATNNIPVSVVISGKIREE